ncbi:uncharacterized protein M6B38_264930 [Iris pallida]|uniref:Uncharacterized protein n=1 Tax=Iris pallida TaxID=29817 RepID=A0AAX6IC13_IRIPA|nr:uncharacterized protein M6B38_264930 [Iris pallida]
MKLVFIPFFGLAHSKIFGWQTSILVVPIEKTFIFENLSFFMRYIGGITWWLDAETHLVMNSNVADKIIYRIDMGQSIVQVAHSHNPPSLRRIHFNYSY